MRAGVVGVIGNGSTGGKMSLLMMTKMRAGLVSMIRKGSSGGWGSSSDKSGGKERVAAVKAVNLQYGQAGSDSLKLKPNTTNTQSELHTMLQNSLAQVAKESVQLLEVVNETSKAKKLAVIVLSINAQEQGSWDEERLVMDKHLEERAAKAELQYIAAANIKQLEEFCKDNNSDVSTVAKAAIKAAKLDSIKAIQV